MLKIKFQATLLILMLLSLYSCGGEPPPTLDAIKASLKNVKNCSIILDDMDVKGNIFKDYFHKYRIIQGEDSHKTDLLKVSKTTFNHYQPHLNMTIWSKKDGIVSDAVGPPGYNYVGNRNYGEWRTGSSGQSFWVFYGQYRLFSDLLGGPVYRHDYDSYSRYRSKYKHKPYYGSKNQYGTRGSFTKKKKPNFYKRKVAKSKSSFASKVSKRIGRTRTKSRSRSKGIGK
ncbi:hypothetical protein QUF90_26525 [Desulfococcaceae bacterium HSG9]|nr:hypothetical protein [Desulfococcaceae bacterium HSG9]